MPDSNGLLVHGAGFQAIILYRLELIAASVSTCQFVPSPAAPKHLRLEDRWNGKLTLDFWRWK